MPGDKEGEQLFRDIRRITHPNPPEVKPWVNYFSEVQYPEQAPTQEQRLLSGGFVGYLRYQLVNRDEPDEPPSVTPTRIRDWFARFRQEQIERHKMFGVQWTPPEITLTHVLGQAMSSYAFHYQLGTDLVGYVEFYGHEDKMGLETAEAHIIEQSQRDHMETALHSLELIGILREAIALEASPPFAPPASPSAGQQS